MKSFHLIILILTCFISDLDSQGSIKLNRIDETQGLPYLSINCIFQDSKGFMWIGTTNGLIRYDSYDFIIFNYDPVYENNISSNVILDIVEDADSNIWIATDYGLNRYIVNKNKFENFIYQPGNDSSISSNHVTDLLVDSNNQIWAATRNGLNLIKSELGNKIYFRRYYFGKKDDKNESCSITSLIEGDEQNLYAGTWDGSLYIFNHQKQVFLKYSNPGLNITTLDKGENNLLWVGTYNDGVHYFNTKTDSIFHPLVKQNLDFSDEQIHSLLYDDEKRLWIATSRRLHVLDSLLNPISINANPTNNNEVSYIFEDKMKKIWIAYRGSGIDIYNPYQNRFSNFYYEIDKSSNFRDYFTSMVKDHDDNVWLGTFDDGLIKTGENFNLNKRYLVEENEISDNRIFDMCLDSLGYLWVGTGNGLNKIDTRTNTLVDILFYKKNNNESLPNSSLIEDLSLDKKGRLWIVSSGETNCIDTRTGKILHNSLTQKISKHNIRKIHVDDYGNVWLVSEKQGLIKLNTKNNEVKIYKPDIYNSNSLSGFHITDLLHGKSKNSMWVTTTNGLNQINLVTDSITHYFEKDGLLNNILGKMVEDKSSRLWVLSPNGVSILNTITEEINNYSKQEGLEVNGKILYIDKQGEIYIGKEGGLYIFSPESIDEQVHDYPIYFTGLSIKGKEITAGMEPLMEKSIENTNNIVLKHSNNQIVISFKALNYNKYKKDRYEYMISGMNDRWISLGNKHNLGPLALPPGNYTLSIAYTSNNSNKSIKSLNIHVMGPWWKSWWFFILVLVALTVLILMYRRNIIKRERKRSLLEEQQVAQRKKLELNNLRLKLYFNVAHEFKTPLTVILGILDQLNSLDLSKKIKNQHQLVIRNVSRLNNLVNQILDLRKIDITKENFKPGENNFKSFISEKLMTFYSLSKMKKIKLIVRTNFKDPTCWFDFDITEKIIANLMSNAIKFTPPGGEVHFQAEITEKDESKKAFDSVSRLMKRISKGNIQILEGRYIMISVSDNGIGIAEHELDKIANRFYQGENQNLLPKEGSGIGLSLIKESIEMLNGFLFVKSNTTGTIFTVMFPCDKSAFNETNFLSIGEASREKNKIANKSLGENEKPEFITSREPNEKITLLLVEDNHDLLEYTKQLLSKFYTVFTAKNGREAIELTRDTEFDLVLTDVMMPEMDGMELCKRLRNDDLTSHVPILFFTAIGAEENKIQSYNIGVDGYIEKPFSKNLLLAKINALLSNRRLIKQKFSSTSMMIPEGVALTKADEKFLTRAIEIINENISNSEFDQNMFFKEIGKSKGTVYRKIKGLTNQSVGDFIRTIRLKKAAQILESGKKINISELADIMGFSTPSYFSSCFRKQYGLTPSEYNQKFQQFIHRET